MFDTVKSGWFIIYIEGSEVIITKRYCISFSEDQFCLSKFKMVQILMKYHTYNAAFHLGLRCLPKYLLRGFWSTNRPLVKSVYQIINFLISQLKHMLWVLKRTVSLRRFF